MDNNHSIKYRYKSQTYECTCGQTFKHDPGSYSTQGKLSEHLQEVIAQYTPSDPVFVGRVNKKRVTHEYWVYDFYHADYPEDGRNYMSPWWVWERRHRVMMKDSAGWKYRHGAPSQREAIAAAVMDLSKRATKGEEIELADDIETEAVPAQRLTIVQALADLLEQSNRASTISTQAEALKQINEVLTHVDLLYDAKDRLLRKMQP